MVLISVTNLFWIVSRPRCLCFILFFFTLEKYQTSRIPSYQCILWHPLAVIIASSLFLDFLYLIYLEWYLIFLIWRSIIYFALFLCTKHPNEWNSLYQSRMCLADISIWHFQTPFLCFGHNFCYFDVNLYLAVVKESYHIHLLGCIKLVWELSI